MGWGWALTRTSARSLIARYVLRQLEFAETVRGDEAALAIFWNPVALFALGMPITLVPTYKADVVARPVGYFFFIIFFSHGIPPFTRPRLISM